ncbi:MAG TPA: PAS domain S-box protein [Puia sp.]|nr:PAS domain S-box protein [Puia sp.]
MAAIHLAEPSITKLLSGNNMLRHLAFDNAAQANIISIVSSGKIIVVNNAACKLLGYSKKELLTKNRAEIFDITENGFKKMLKQRMAEGQSKGLVTAIKKNGKIFPAEITSAVFMDEDGFEKSITSIVDISQRVEKQKQKDIKKEKIVAHNIVLAKSEQKEIDLSKQNDLEQMHIEYEKKFKLIFNSSSDILYDVDLLADEVILSDAYEKQFGYKLINNMATTEDWFSHIHPADKEEVMQDYHRMLASRDNEWSFSFRFLRADDSVANVITRGVVLRNSAGQAYRRIGYMQDISKQKVLEERLEQEIKLKEKQIAEAREEAKETARLDIGKELHDNVNQLLGASGLYLNMAKQGGEGSEMYLSRSSEYMHKAIEEIRKLTQGLTTGIIPSLGICEAIYNVSKDAMEVAPVKISCALEVFLENKMSDKFKLNIFRIVQEQLNNVLKHSKATEATISLSQNEKLIILSISDNGIGFDTGKTQEGIGLANIKGRAASYNGTAYFLSRPAQGCVLTVNFPVKDAL